MNEGMRRSVRGRLAVAVAFVALLLLPAPAGAVLSGFNGSIVFVSGRGEASDATAKLYLRTVTSGAGAGAVGPTITPMAGVQHRHPTWSPDRTKVAYARGTPGSPTTENFDIYVHDLTTGTVTPITTEGNNLSSDRPAWSPDGTKIAWEEQPSAGSADRYILVHNVATGASSNWTTAGGPVEGKPAWAPDSQTLYYTTGDPNGAPPTLDSNILKQTGSSPATATLAVPDSQLSEFQPSISPDGTRICFTLGSGFNATASVLTASLANPASQTVLATGGGGNYNCTWSPDGTKIAYVNGIFSTGALVMENSDNSGGLVVLEEVAARFDGNPDWAPDGRPACEDTAVTTVVNSPVTITLSCADTGPAYERTDVLVDLPPDATPANGTVGAVQQGPPGTVTYTPNAGFTGTDSFQFRSRDGLAFGGRGTATVNVVAPAGGPGPGGQGPGPTCAGKPATLVATGGRTTGTGRRDVIVGTRGRDVIRARGGNDLVCGRGGNDVILGGPGRDELRGDGGKDTLRGQGGNDRLLGAGGPDRLFGGPGKDTLRGGPGRDRERQ